MDSGKLEFLIGLIIGAIFFSLMGIVGVITTLSSINNLRLDVKSKISNFFGIIGGVLLILGMLFSFGFMVYIWLRY